jgi:hypothetical protein
MGAGECNAVIAEAADVPEPADAIDCGRAFVRPETGSVLDAGHRPRGAFLRAAHVDASPDEEVAPRLFGCDAVETVEVEDALELSEEDELERWTLLRGMNIWR